MRRNKKVDTRMRIRINHDAKVDVQSGDQLVLKGLLRDISQQSLYFYSDGVHRFELDIEQTFFVKLYMEHGESALAVEARGLVVRTDALGCAICFTHPLLWWPVFSVFPIRKTDGRESSGQSVPGSFNSCIQESQNLFY